MLVRRQVNLFAGVELREPRVLLRTAANPNGGWILVINLCSERFIDLHRRGCIAAFGQPLGRAKLVRVRAGECIQTTGGSLGDHTCPGKSLGIPLAAALVERISSVGPMA